MAVADLGQAAARARQAHQNQVPEPESAPHAPEVIQAETAFLVYRLPSGQVVMDTNLDAPVIIRRPPVAHDVITMSHAVVADVTLMASAPQIAQGVVAILQQQQQQAMKDAQDAQLWAQAQQAQGRVPRD